MLRFGVAHAVRIAAVALLHSCFDTPVGFTLEALSPGDRVPIHYESRGCFHEIAADFVFTRVAGGLLIRGRNASANLAPGLQPEVDHWLDMSELRRLDAMLS